MYQPASFHFGRRFRRYITVIHQAADPRPWPPLPLLPTLAHGRISRSHSHGLRCRRWPMGGSPGAPPGEYPLPPAAHRSPSRRCRLPPPPPLPVLPSPPLPAPPRRLLPPRPCLAFHPLSRRLLPVPSHPSVDSSSSPLVSSPSPSILVTASSHLLLPPLPVRSYLIAVIARRPSSSTCHKYTLVAVTTGVGLRSYTLDSADPSPRWGPRGELPRPFAVLGKAAVNSDRGRFFVLGRGPDSLIVFDIATGQWTVPPVVMPHGLTSAHLFMLDGRLFLIGGAEGLGVLERVVVWQLDKNEAVGWVEVAVMPAEVFDELVADRHSSFWHFHAADRMGIVCLYNAVDGRLVMFDAVVCAWTRLPRVSGLDVEESRRWFGHVMEPGTELLLGQH